MRSQWRRPERSDRERPGRVSRTRDLCDPKLGRIHPALRDRGTGQRFRVVFRGAVEACPLASHHDFEIGVGVSARSVDPFPSAPCRLSPQHRIESSSAVTAHVNPHVGISPGRPGREMSMLPPAAIELKRRGVATRWGAAASWVDPSPSSPSVLVPQQYAVPSRVRAQSWKGPVVTKDSSPGIDTRSGTGDFI
jgi:hypothetical protein